MLFPRYFEGENVSFKINDNKTLEGVIYIVDKGIWGDTNNVYYDIMVDDDNGGMLYKHIQESNVIGMISKRYNK